MMAPEVAQVRIHSGEQLAERDKTLSGDPEGENSNERADRVMRWSEGEKKRNTGTASAST